MGIYPIGSVVELNDGRIAIVTDYSDGSQKDLPLLQTLVADGEGGMARGEVINLTALARKESSPGINIVRCVSPSRIGVPVVQFLLKED